MITSLHIENIAIIRCVDLEFSDGFTVLTGETGAGKSIIIDAINLLSGGRSTRELIRHGEDKAEVSAVFSGIGTDVRQKIAQLGYGESEDDSVLLQRSITIEGKSVARCNGRTISVAPLRELSRMLIHIHGQNDNQAFLNEENHICFLDDYAGVGERKDKYRDCYEKMCSIKSQIHALAKSDKEKNREKEMLEFQIGEIRSVDPKPGEEEKLDATRLKIQNAEKIQTYASGVISSLKNEENTATALELIAQAEEALSQLKEFLPEADSFIQRLASCRFEIDDIATSMEGLLGGEEDGLSVNIDRIEERLDAFRRLKRKYGADIPEVLAYRDQCEQELKTLAHSEERISELKKELKAAGAQALTWAKELSVERSVAGENLSRGIMAELAYLDMEKVHFEVRVEPDKDAQGNWLFNENGIDRVAFYIATNPGEPMMPIGKVASGGELARIMLASKCVLNDATRQTMIFDEIDTGVSGKTSQKIGIKMRQLAAGGGQVMAVTHSAQIAAMAHSHFLIGKEEDTDGRIITQVHQLTQEERALELARIMGGIEITDSIRNTAREMLENSAKMP